MPSKGSAPFFLGLLKQRLGFFRFRVLKSKSRFITRGNLNWQDHPSEGHANQQSYYATDQARQKLGKHTSGSVGRIDPPTGSAPDVSEESQHSEKIVGGENVLVGSYVKACRREIEIGIEL